MSVREYIGARYVPLFADPIEWDITKTYEPLTIVYHQGNSYTSRQAVPTGIAITNETYWALTGNYNAQIEAYRTEVQEYTQDVAGFETRISGVEDEIGSGFDSTNTVAAAIGVLGNDISAEEDARIASIAELHSEISRKKSGTVLSYNVIGEFDCNEGLGTSGHIGGLCEAPNNDIVVIGNKYNQINNEGFWRKMNIAGNVDYWSSSKQDSLLGHANSIAYFDANSVYVEAPIFKIENGTQTTVHEIWTFNDSGVRQAVINAPKTILGVCYDYETDVLYALATDMSLYSVDSSYNFTLVKQLERPSYNPNSYQDFAIKGNDVYFCNVWGEVDHYSLESGKMISSSQLYNTSYKNGELCSLTFASNGALLGIFACWVEKSFPEEYGYLVEIIVDKEHYSNYATIYRENQEYIHVNQLTSELRKIKSFTAVEYIKYLANNLTIFLDSDYQGILRFPSKNNIRVHQQANDLTLYHACYIDGNMCFEGSGQLNFGDLKITGNYYLGKFITFQGTLTVKSNQTTIMNSDAGIQFFRSANAVTFETFTHIWTNIALQKGKVICNEVFVSQ